MPKNSQKRRKLRITELVIRGNTAPIVAKKYSISIQRVSQLCLEVVGDLSRDYKEIPLTASIGIKEARKYKDEILAALKHQRLKS